MMGSSQPSSDGRRPEKSKFVNTCNLLSRYMKEKGSLRDLNLEIGGKVESLEAIVKPGSTHFASASTTLDVVTDKGKSNEQHPIDSSFNTAHNLTSKEVAAKNSQLTIFYSGRVLVFDECPADKAKEVIAFAKKQTSQISYGILSNSTVLEKPSSPREGLPPRPQASTTSHKNSYIAEKPAEPKESADLPIARRSSLHRFLEKRKDRAVVRGPYHHQVQEQPGSSSYSKDDEHLELKL